MNIIYPKATEEQEQYGERYALSIERIDAIHKETSQNQSQIPSRILPFFQSVSEYILLTDTVYQQVADGSLYQLPLSALQEINYRLFEDILPENYTVSYANPSYAVQKLGQELGSLLCFLYTELRANIAYAFEKRLFYLTTSAELFIEVYNLLENSFCTSEEVKNAIYFYLSDYCDITMEDRTAAMLDSSYAFATSIIQTADLNDLRYLYYFGEYISQNECQTAAYLNEMNKEQIEAMASTYTKGYEKGFALYGINLSAKSTVNIRYRLGFEQVIRAAILQFEEMGLKPSIYRAAVSLIHKNARGAKVGYCSTSPNPQYDYDHRLDEALFLDKAFTDRRLSMQRHAYETHKELAAQFAGPAVIEVFGERPFTPVTKPEAPEFTKKQQKIRLEYQTASSLMSNEYIPGEQVSFTIIAYPLPEIGEQYKDIFEETIRVNTLDSAQYEKIQTKIINALDQGDYVTITGRNSNRTNLKVELPKLENPETQTNFENCLADVNIPLGEVFTSPQLAGTSGILHITQVYLNELKYIDLELTIEEGIIKDYHCKNFASEEENRKFIEQNLLFHHATLPMGEFAIGTNTTAYVMGQRFGISHLLPILIAEKTGPHFAFGDTCFSHEEDLKTYNPDGKQMMAKENAFSALRNTQPEKAYFNCHTDITIPYHELGDIVVHHPDGSTEYLIQNGRFVLPGSEALNAPLDQSLSISSL